MKIFVDTSSLFKLYHFENNSVELLALFNQNDIEAVYLSEITKIEFDSVVWKKFRKGELEESKVIATISNFEKDSTKYSFIKDSKRIKIAAKNLISKYGKEGLRTLDAIRLASVLFVKKECNLFLTSDKLLQNLFKMEALKVME